MIFGDLHLPGDFDQQRHLFLQCIGYGICDISGGDTSGGDTSGGDTSDGDTSGNDISARMQHVQALSVMSAINCAPYDTWI